MADKNFLQLPQAHHHRSRPQLDDIQACSSESAGSSSDAHSPEVTEGSIEVWRGLPEIIRDDPSLAPFREQHEKLHGGPLDEHDHDPLRDDDELSDKEHTSSTEPASAIHKQNFITINVTNELGQSKQLDSDNDKLNPNDKEHDHEGHKKHSSWFTNSKIGFLLIVWLAFTVVLMNTSEKALEFRQLAVPVGHTRNFVLQELPIRPRMAVILRGAFNDAPVFTTNTTTTTYLHVYVQSLYLNSPAIDGTYNRSDVEYTENITEIQTLAMFSDDELDTAPESRKTLIFDLGKTFFSQIHNPNTVLRVRLRTNNTDSTIPLQFAYDPTPIDQSAGVLYAAILLVGLYVLIIWEIVHRTFAAMFASTAAIAILAAMGARPTMPEIMSWIDVETLLLLFGMMILVAILSETGIFDYLAVFAYKITSGRVWPLINCLCLFTAVLSSFLDNVTTVLLMTPVSIRLCEVMGLNPVPILMAMIIYSNVGGATTPVGDPPNVIIASNRHIAGGGVTFLNFTMHMTVGILLVLVQTYFQLRFQYRDMNTLRFREPQNVQDLRHEITVWQRAAASLSSYSKDEDMVRETLLKKVHRLNKQLKKRIASGSVPTASYKATLEELEAKYPIRNKKLLIQSSITLVFVISFFFLHSMPHIQRLSLGWTALLGAILLLILADREDIESVLARVEWTTLLFFAALFILMESLALLGLIEWIGKQTETVIMSVSEESRLAVAILIILWVSAIASAFVDNIPLTTMMVKIAVSLAENEALGLPLQPLVWALAFGACLGGNGTLIGASANVVCAGVAEQHGYRFTFVEYFKVGFPMMIGSIIVTTVYLMVCHVLFEWH